MQDRIIEAGSIMVPLVQLRSLTDASPKSVSIVIGTPSNPKQKQQKLEAEKQKELLEADEDYDEDDAKEDEGKSHDRADDKADEKSEIGSSNSSEVFQPQPYIVTRFVVLAASDFERLLIRLRVCRTQLRLIDDQSKYSLKAFNKRHNKLKATSVRTLPRRLRWAPC